MSFPAGNVITTVGFKAYHRVKAVIVMAILINVVYDQRNSDEMRHQNCYVISSILLHEYKYVTK